MTKARDLANASTALSAVSATELAFVDGVTSAIQTQLDAKATLTGTETLTNKTLTNPVIASVVNNTLTSTTGDIIYASAANTPARLGIGSSAQVLTVASGIPSWAAPAAGGKVLQVVYAKNQTEATSSSNTYADTGITATITPTSASSKILVLVAVNGMEKSANFVNNGVKLRLLRAGSQITLITEYGGYTADASVFVGSAGLDYLDSPATTSATIYKVQFANIGNQDFVRVQKGDVCASSITLMEIGA